MTTQIEAFQAWAVYLRDNPAERATAEKAMREIVGMAQNRPPLGVSDGSFTNGSWRAARDLMETAATILRLEADLRARVERIARGDFVTDAPMYSDYDDDIPF